jgi:hypothetical protein
LLRAFWLPKLAALCRDAATDSPREDPSDDFLDGDFLDVYVADREFIEQGFADRDDAVAFDLELDAAGVLGHEFAVSAQLRVSNSKPARQGGADLLHHGRFKLALQAL